MAAPLVAQSRCRTCVLLKGSSIVEERVSNMSTPGRFQLTRFVVYARLEDTDGQLDCLAMKVRLAEVRDDENSATQAESLYGLLLASKEERELA